MRGSSANPLVMSEMGDCSSIAGAFAWRGAAAAGDEGLEIGAGLEVGLGVVVDAGAAALL